MTEKRIRVLIVDDEERGRRILRQLLERQPDTEIVGETAGADTPDAIRELRPDVVFLDVQMPTMNGFDVLRELSPGELPLIIFVTAYEEHALEAFEVAAVDYLLKPFSDDRFRTALGRARDAIRAGDVEKLRARVERVLDSLDAPDAARAADVSGQGVEEGRSTLLFRDAGRTHLLHPSEIDWIEAEDMYVRIHAGQRTLLVRESLTALEDRLESMGFYRIHRSAIVRLDRIVELKHHSHGDYRVLLRNGTELTLARTRKEGLEARLGHSLG